jgi:hypothetical protein
MGATEDGPGGPTWDEIRTRRLVVVDDQGQERVVAQVVWGTAELRVGLPGTGSEVVLFASPGRHGLDPGLGLQLWAGGQSVLELDAWPGPGGRWRVSRRGPDPDAGGPGVRPSGPGPGPGRRHPEGRPG